MPASTADQATLPIVFVSQLGCGADIWKPVLDYMAGYDTVTYDRPGTGSALPRPAPNPAIPHSVFAAELAGVLNQRQVNSPVVLVGHSFGGLIARVFAATWPGRIAGLVMVDSSIPPMHLTQDEDPKIDGDGPDATEIDAVRGHAEIIAGRLPNVPALVLTRTPGTWDGENPPPHPRH